MLFIPLVGAPLVRADGVVVLERQRQTLEVDSLGAGAGAGACLLRVNLLFCLTSR